MIAADTSVVVAAFASWHEKHEQARSALAGRAALPAQCAVEAYSTLTRMPEPFRASPALVAEYLDRRFGGRILVLDAAATRTLPTRLASLGISGGAIYDALIAATASAAAATLVTLDERATRVYLRMGVKFRALTD